MKENTDIEAEIARLSSQIGEKEAAADEASGRAGLLYRRGKLYWKLGRKGEAMSDYASAAQLDPGSPAVQALDQAQAIMSFFNKGLYNP